MIHLGLVHRNGKEIGIFTCENNYKFDDSSVSYQKDFDKATTFFLSETDDKLNNFISFLFDNDYTLENNFGVYFTLNKTKLEKYSLTYAITIGIHVICLDNIEQNTFTIIEGTEPLHILLNGRELRDVLPPIHIPTIFEQTEQMRNLLEEMFIESHSLRYPLQTEKETFFTRKKKMRFLSR